jgi:hypothetical protein
VDSRQACWWYVGHPWPPLPNGWTPFCPWPVCQRRGRDGREMASGRGRRAQRRNRAESVSSPGLISPTALVPGARRCWYSGVPSATAGGANGGSVGLRRKRLRLRRSAVLGVVTRGTGGWAAAVPAMAPTAASNTVRWWCYFALAWSVWARAGVRVRCVRVRVCVRHVRVCVECSYV